MAARRVYKARRSCHENDHFLSFNFIFISEPRMLSARFLIDLTKEVAGSEEESREKPIVSGQEIVAKQGRDSAMTGISTG